MSEFEDIHTCITDMAHGPLLFGRADGISCRTIEIMEAFNSSDMVVRKPISCGTPSGNQTLPIRKISTWKKV